MNNDRFHTASRPIIRLNESMSPCQPSSAHCDLVISENITFGMPDQADASNMAGNLFSSWL